MAGKYLFIRILEACNADCFMCDFAKSKDRFRFGVDQLLDMMPRLREEGIEYVRFTGGEPLLHKDIIKLIQALTDNGLKSSIITNGTILKSKAKELSEAGLGQIIVSIDGLEQTHDTLRGTPGLYRRCIEGLEAARNEGILLRVNSVVGPDNFYDMPELQDILTEIGVVQWEMSSLKLETRLDYSDADRTLIESQIIPEMFDEAREKGKLIPFGKIWCGDTQTERDVYFATGKTPSADRVCHIVDRVRYLDAKAGKIYPCSLIPHRIPETIKSFPETRAIAPDFSQAMNQATILADYYREAGPTECTGCSTTAAGLSNNLDKGKRALDWDF